MKKWIKGLTVLCATTTLYTGCGTSKEDALLEKTQKVYENVDDAHNSVKNMQMIFIMVAKHMYYRAKI